jgi:hypothetical protein
MSQVNDMLQIQNKPGLNIAKPAPVSSALNIPEGVKVTKVR